MLITPQELASNMQAAADHNTVVVDCRFDLQDPDAGRAAWLSGHIPGACYADLNKDLAGPVGPDTGRHPLPDRDTFAATLGGWGITPGQRVVIYDAAGGAIAARLWWLLRWMGHTRVALLDGSLQAWEAAGGPLDTVQPVPGSGRYPDRAPGMEVITVEALQEHLDKDRLSLIDARDAARFAGEVEPLDPVAGHVPGALNRPFSENLTDAGRFKPAEQLRAEFEALLQGRPAAVASMCGSGVTACHNLFAMELAGLPSGTLYVGSWSGWISNSSRAVAGSGGR